MAAMQSGFSPVDSNKFFEGMFVSTDLYCKYKTNYVLVFRSALLTQKLIQKIKQLEATYGSLYVENEHYQKIIDQFEQYEGIIKRLEFDTNYNAIKEKTTNILNTIVEKNTVSREAVSIVTKIITDKINDVDAATIFQLINSVREPEEYLAAHCTNVAFLNGLIGKWLELGNKEISSLVCAGLIHDIGKLRIPNEILNKPDKLTEKEFEIIKTHPVHSYDMLVAAGELNPDVLSAARNHHEKINGAGYPDGLQFEKISRSARITALSDMYDAMVTRREYREAHSPFEILDEFARSSFTDLDLDIVNTFLKHMPFELIGKSVLLSNGSIAKVSYIDPDNFSFPLVQAGNKVIQTDATLKCVCMCRTED